MSSQRAFTEISRAGVSAAEVKPMLIFATAAPSQTN
jgi:hypothetical protein